MVGICRFWQQGNCRNGNNCRFLHSNGNDSTPISNNNRFAALQTPENSPNNVRNSFHNRSGGNNFGNQPTQSQKPAVPYQIENAAITTDLSTERPQWILSAYGPGRAAPAQLFGGPVREKSFEEMRLYHYQAMAAGAAQQAIQEADALYQQSEQQIQTILDDVDGAIQFIINAEKTHTNRLDIVKESGAAAGQPLNPFNSTSTHTQSNPNPFGGHVRQTPSAFGASSGGGTFGQPSALGQKPSAFGAPSQPAFGQPSQPASTSAFGAPSQPAGAFGAPSALGQKPNPFGALSGAGTFGAPSELGQKSSPFGALSGSSAPAANPFGGQNQSANPNPFSGQPAASTGVFGTPSQPNPFAGPSQPTPNPFGNPSAQQNPYVSRQGPALSESSTAQTPFGKPQSSGFGFPSQTAPVNPFRNPGSSSTGVPSQTATVNPFAKTQPRQNGLGLTAGLVPQASTSNNFPATSQSPLPSSLSTASLGKSKAVVNSHPPIESYSTKGQDGRLVMFKGKQVEYRDEVPGVLGRDGVWSKIWFPDGPFVRKNNDTQMDDNAYDESTRAAYEHLRQTGVFANAIMPLIPPKGEWVSYEF